MKTKTLFATLLTGAALVVSSCDDDVSGIGSSLISGEVTITVDSLETDLKAVNVYEENFDGRNITKLIGRINVPEYGKLDCSFVSQMMAATSMNIPDSITENRIDSVRIIFGLPKGSLTGDSLAPQQLKVFRLDKQLPGDINTGFDPAGYYDASSPMGVQSYTLSNIAKGDSAVKRATSIRIPVTLPTEFGREVFRKYRANDPIFEWPSTFNQWFPGIYVEQNFGNGCIANISTAEIYTYWNRIDSVYEKLPDDSYGYVGKVKRDSICLMSSQPEVLSSNVISYQTSDYLKGKAESGESIITTPGGYRVDITFPIKPMLEGYLTHGDHMAVVSSLRLEIPARTVKNDYGLTIAPYLLMVRRSEREEFFNNNKLPDGKTSFYATYNAETGSYQFNSMRSYFLDELEKFRNGEEIPEADYEFSLIPVNVNIEVVQGYNTTTSYVTRVQPYIIKPTMTQLFADKAIVCFTYSSQELE